MAEIAKTPAGKRAAIKRASKRSRADLRRIDAKALNDLDTIYRQAADNIAADIAAAAAGDGHVRLEAMRQLLNQVETRISQLSAEMDRQLSSGFDQAAAAATVPFNAVVDAGVLMQVNHDAVQFVRNFIAEDGLQLSDRIWRIDRHAREVVGQAVQQAVVQGYSASQAADEFLKRGDRIPAELLAKMGKANAARISREAGNALLFADGSPRYNAMRLFRTEINRAHGEAYQAASFEHPDTIGTRFLLSPNHRTPDICNMHARVNRYGLGPGVYPKGKNPWPAHPNTISFTEVVFADEVSKADKAGKQTRPDFLKAQPPGLRASILGGQKKRAAFDAGHIPESAISTPWKTIKKRLERKGVNIEALTKQPASPVAPLGSGGIHTPVSNALDALSYKGEVAHVLGVIDSIHTDGDLPVIPVKPSVSKKFYGAFYRKGGKATKIAISSYGDHKEFTLAHEIGHFIDLEGIGGKKAFATESGAMSDIVKAMKGSDAINTINMALQSGGISPKARKYARYLLTEKEMWARAYSQWVAKKSGDGIMLKQLDQIRIDNEAIGLPSQWSDADFVPIADKIDARMGELGWL